MPNYQPKQTLNIVSLTLTQALAATLLQQPNPAQDQKQHSRDINYNKIQENKKKNSK